MPSIYGVPFSLGEVGSSFTLSTSSEESISSSNDTSNFSKISKLSAPRPYNFINRKRREGVPVSRFMKSKTKGILQNPSDMSRILQKECCKCKKMCWKKFQDTDNTLQLFKVRNNFHAFESYADRRKYLASGISFTRGLFGNYWMKFYCLSGFLTLHIVNFLRSSSDVARSSSLCFVCVESALY